MSETVQLFSHYGLEYEATRATANRERARLEKTFPAIAILPMGASAEEVAESLRARVDKLTANAARRHARKAAAIESAPAAEDAMSEAIEAALSRGDGPEAYRLIRLRSEAHKAN